MAAAASRRTSWEEWRSFCLTKETASRARAGRASRVEQKLRVERRRTCTSSSSSSSSFVNSLGTSARRALAPAGHRTHVITENTGAENRASRGQ